MLSIKKLATPWDYLVLRRSKKKKMCTNEKSRHKKKEKEVSKRTCVQMRNLAIRKGKRLNRTFGQNNEL